MWFRRIELTSAQQNELKATLKGVAGKDVTINVTVDPSILGGLIVKMGSASDRHVPSHQTFFS